MILIIVAVVLIASLLGLVWWIKAVKIVIDSETLCPKTGPYLVHALIFDQSDPILPQQAQQIRQKIKLLKDEARPGYRFDIYTFEGDTKNVLTPILSICSPGRKEDANELYENPELFRRRYDERFSRVLDNVVVALLKQSTRDNSPIIESLKAAATSSFGPFNSEKTRFRVTMISDMVQHTALHSQFRSELNFAQLARSSAWTSLRPNLRGANVEIIYLGRPEAKRGGAPIQNRGHQLFWEQLIAASNGNLLKFEPI